MTIIRNYNAWLFISGRQDVDGLNWYHAITWYKFALLYVRHLQQQITRSLH